MIFNSSDFLGINFYTSNVVYTEEGDLENVDWNADQDVGAYQDDTWFAAGSVWLKV